MRYFEITAYSEEAHESATFTIEAADRVAAIEVLAIEHPEFTVEDFSAVTECDENWKALK